MQAQARRTVSKRPLQNITRLVLFSSHLCCSGPSSGPGARRAPGPRNARGGGGGGRGGVSGARNPAAAPPSPSGTATKNAEARVLQRFSNDEGGPGGAARRPLPAAQRAGRAAAQRHRPPPCRLRGGCVRHDEHGAKQIHIVLYLVDNDLLRNKQAKRLAYTAANNQII